MNKLGLFLFRTANISYYERVYKRTSERQIVKRRRLCSERRGIHAYYALFYFFALKTFSFMKGDDLMVIRTLLEILAIVTVVILVRNEPAIVDWEDRQIEKIKSTFNKRES